MTEYLPVFTDGLAVTYKASTTITGGQVVAVTGTGTVGPAGAGSAAWIGVASNDAVTNDNVTVYSGGVQHVTASTAVTAGDSVVTGVAGTVATDAAPTPAKLVGTALTGGGSGAKIRVKFTR